MFEMSDAFSEEMSPLKSFANIFRNAFRDDCEINSLCNDEHNEVKRYYRATLAQGKPNTKIKEIIKFQSDDKLNN